MLVRARRYGLPVYRVALPTGSLLSQAFYSTLYATGASARAPRQPSGSLTPKTIRPQLRVLQTCSQAKIPYSPQTAATSLNWSSTIHRIRHVSPSAMTTQTQTRSHAGHSHHHHHHDNTFLLSKNKSDAGVRITRIGLYVNLGMAVSKGVGGYVFNSQGEQLTCI
jgi:hypothetical protein